MPFDWTGVADGATGGIIGGGFTVLALRTTLSHDRQRVDRERLDQAIESVQDAAAELVKDAVRTGEVQTHAFHRLRRAHLTMLQRIPKTMDPQHFHEMDSLWQTVTEQFPQVSNRIVSPTFLIMSIEAYTNCVAITVRPVEFASARRSLWQRVRSVLLPPRTLP
jgi:hypothetical protein